MELEIPISMCTRWQTWQLSDNPGENRSRFVKPGWAKGKSPVIVAAFVTAMMSATANKEPTERPARDHGLYSVQP